MERSFPCRAPYVAEIVERAKNMMVRFGGRIDVRNIYVPTRGWDEATMVVVEEPTGLLCPSGLADRCDWWYARKVAHFGRWENGYCVVSALNENKDIDE